MTDPTPDDRVDYAQEHVDRGTDQLGPQVCPVPEDPGAPAIVDRPWSSPATRGHTPESTVDARVTAFAAGLSG